MMFIHFKTTIVLLVLLTILSIIPGHGQDNKILWGPVYHKDDGLFDRIHLLGMDDQFYYIHTTPKGNDLIKFYNDKHQLKHEVNVQEQTQRKDLALQYLFKTTNGLYGYFISHKQDKILTINVAQLNGEKFGKVKEVANLTLPYAVKQNTNEGFVMPYLGLGQISTPSMRSLPLMAMSHDQNHLAFLQILSKGYSETMRVAIVALNGNLELLWKDIIELDGNHGNAGIEQFEISDEGTVYLVHNMDFDVTGITNPKLHKTVEFKVIAVNHDGLRTIPIKFNSGYAPDEVKLFVPTAHQDQFMIAGFYSKMTDKKYLDGLFTARGNVKSNALDINLRPLPDSILRQLITGKEIKKDKGLPINYYVDRLVEFSDGQFAFIAEQRYVTTEWKTSSNNTTKVYYYYNADYILVPFFNEKGEMTAIPIIKKKYLSAELGAESYCYAVRNDEIYLVYNDLKSKAERSDLKDDGMKGKYYTDFSLVSHDGKETLRKTLFTDKDYELLFTPFLSVYRDDVFLIGTSSLNKYSFGKIDLQ